MTHLRKQMLEELQRRNYAQNTARTYIKIIERFAKHFGRFGVISRSFQAPTKLPNRRAW